MKIWVGIQVDNCEEFNVVGLFSNSDAVNEFVDDNYCGWSEDTSDPEEIHYDKQPNRACGSMVYFRQYELTRSIETNLTQDEIQYWASLYYTITDMAVLALEEFQKLMGKKGRVFTTTLTDANQDIIRMEGYEPWQYGNLASTELPTSWLGNSEAIRATVEENLRIEAREKAKEAEDEAIRKAKREEETEKRERKQLARLKAKYEGKS